MRLLLISLAMLLANSAVAQKTMGDALKSMPDSLMPYLSHNNRLDCIDFSEANMKAEVRNALEGKSELLQLTNSYALFRMNDASTVEFCLLDDDNLQLVCMIQTYGTDLRESTIAFYTTSWKPLATQKYLPIAYEGFAANYDAAQKMLTLENSGFLNRVAMEDQKEEKKVQIKLKWLNGCFKES